MPLPPVPRTLIGGITRADLPTPGKEDIVHVPPASTKIGGRYKGLEDRDIIGVVDVLTVFAMEQEDKWVKPWTSMSEADLRGEYNILWRKLPRGLPWTKINDKMAIETLRKKFFEVEVRLLEYMLYAYINKKFPSKTAEEKKEIAREIVKSREHKLIEAKTRNELDLQIIQKSKYMEPFWGDGIYMDW